MVGFCSTQANLGKTTNRPPTINEDTWQITKNFRRITDI